MRSRFFILLAFGMIQTYGLDSFGFDRLEERSRILRKDLVNVSPCYRVGGKEHTFQLVFCEERQTYLVKQTFEVIAGLYQRVTSENLVPDSISNYGVLSKEQTYFDRLSSDLDSEIHEIACKKARDAFTSQIVTTRTTCGNVGVSQQ